MTKVALKTLRPSIRRDRVRDLVQNGDFELIFEHIPYLVSIEKYSRVLFLKQLQLPCRSPKDSNLLLNFDYLKNLNTLYSTTIFEQLKLSSTDKKRLLTQHFGFLITNSTKIYSTSQAIKDSDYSRAFLCILEAAEKVSKIRSTVLSHQTNRIKQPLFPVAESCNTFRAQIEKFLVYAKIALTRCRIRGSRLTAGYMNESLRELVVQGFIVTRREFLAQLNSLTKEASKFQSRL